MKSRATWAFIVSAGLAALVWALSVPLTGKTEPWDAEWPYYFIGLAIAGAVSGAAIPKHLATHYIGAVSGQAAYELVFLKFGPLFVLGLVFLAGYTITFLATAAVVASFRKESANDATAVQQRWSGP